MVVQEYESDDLASNSEDKKCLEKAKNAAEKKMKNPERSKLGSSKRFKFDNNNQFFVVTFVPNLLCYSSLGWERIQRSEREDPIRQT